MVIGSVCIIDRAWGPGFFTCAWGPTPKRLRRLFYWAPTLDGVLPVVTRQPARSAAWLNTEPALPTIRLIEHDPAARGLEAERHVNEPIERRDPARALLLPDQ